MTDAKITVISAIQKHIKEQCPLLSEFDKALGVDYLEEDPTSYMIEPEPVKPIIKSYINGDAEKQYVFAFCSREPWGSDEIQNLNNLGFYEKFEQWLKECTESKNLPHLSDGRKSLRYEALTYGYAHNTNIGKAQYRIQCRLIYFEKG